MRASRPSARLPLPPLRMKSSAAPRPQISATAGVNADSPLVCDLRSLRRSK